MKNADENELHSIASEPHESHVYNVADFNIMSSIVEGLTKTVCEQVEQQDKEIKQSKGAINCLVAIHYVWDKHFENYSSQQHSQ